MSEPTCLATVQLGQPKSGFRFSADAVALASFAQAGPAETLLDLGTGCGVIPILVWRRSPFRHACGVEVDVELSSWARNNVVKFRLEDKIHIVQADIKFLTPRDLQGTSPLVPSGRFDVVTANPPYWPAGRGRVNPDLQKASARHEILLTLADVLAAARRFLKPGGRFYLSHLESRQLEILEGLKEEHFAVGRTQYVSGRTRRMLLEAHLREEGDRLQPGLYPTQAAAPS